MKAQSKLSEIDLMLNSGPRVVSVVVTTKNEEKRLEALLDSLKAQTYPNIEIIVVDNNSIDSTKKIAVKYTERVFNCGPERSVQRNFGVLHSQGDYILILDADMELEPTVIEECVNVVQYDPELKALVIPEESFGQGYWAKCKWLERSCYIGDDAIEAARFFDKTVFVEFGGYDANLTGGEDWDLPCRIKKRYKIGRIQSLIRHNEGNLTLKKIFTKKYYYGGKMTNYLKKHQQSPLNQQTIYFLRPAFYRSWKHLLSHPIILLGMIFVLTLETVAGGSGLISTLLFKYQVDLKTLVRRSRGYTMNIEDYAKKHIHFQAVEIPQLLVKLLSETTWETYLDLGCGDGSLLYALKLKNHFQDKEVYAIDLSEFRIALVKKIDPKFNCFVGSASNIKNITNNKIDLLVSTQVIEHVPSDEEMIYEIKRVLSENGTVYLSTVFKKWYGWYFYRCNGKWTLDPTHVREYTNDTQLLSIIRNLGFEIKENRKTLFAFPLIDFFLRRFYPNRNAYHNRFLSLLRRIKIPIVGYYNWEIIFENKST